MIQRPNSAYPFILRRPAFQSVVPPRTGATATPLLLIRPDTWLGIAEFGRLLAPARRTRRISGAEQLGAAVDDQGGAGRDAVAFGFCTARMAFALVKV